LWGSFELRFIELSSLELALTHEAFGFDPFGIVIRTFSSILEIHQSFERDKPGPLFIAVSSTKIEHVLEGPYLEACRDHVFLFPEVTFIGLDLSQVNELC
jgi:hypothetical protein